MRELSFMGPSNDGRRLLLVADDGTEFELLVDDRLISVVSREHGPAKGAVTAPSAAATVASPREIQEQVRHGASVEELAAQSGVSPEQIARFAHAVLSEREHICGRARKALIRFGPDEIELEVAVIARLRSRDIETALLQWDAWRRADGRWILVVAYPAPQGARVAKFVYNVLDKSIQPADDQARLLIDDPTEAARTLQHPGETTGPTSVPNEAPEVGRVSRSWDKSHPATRAQQRRDLAAEPTPAKPTAPAVAAKPPHWEELLFGTPKSDDRD